MVLRSREDVAALRMRRPPSRVDDPPHAGLAARLEQADRPEHVDARVEARIGDRPADLGLGRVVDDDLRPLGGDQGVEPRCRAGRTS